MQKSKTGLSWTLATLVLAAFTCHPGCNDENNGLFADFLFGTAISGFQADMGCPGLPAEDCTHARVDWYQFATSQKMIDSGGTYLSGQDPAEVGPGHWELYEQDFDLAAETLSNNAFKTTIEWGRLFPAPTDGTNGHENLRARADARVIEHYHALFAAMRSRGLKPLVALNQSTLPSWIHDAVGCHESLANCHQKGWIDRVRVSHEISKFAGFVAKEYGAEVDLWLTLCSPFQVMFSGYLWPSWERANPPALFMNFGGAKAVYAGLVESHARMYDAIKTADQFDSDGDGNNSLVGLGYAVSPSSPANPANDRDVRAAQDAFYLWNHLFLNAFVNGQYDANFDGMVEYRPELANRMDFIGLNYWAAIIAKGTPNPAFPELSPFTRFDPLGFVSDYRRHEAIYEAIMYLHREFGLPIIVSENGATGMNEEEAIPEMIVKRITWIQRAIEDGADVRGHFFYSLVDSFEWNLGMNRTFGLFAVDAEDPEKKRTARPGAGVYDSIAKNAGIPADLALKYPFD